MAYKLEKTASFYGKVSDAPRDIDFWKKKSPQERLDALEFIRTQERVGLNSDLKDFVICLNENNVEYMTIGGFAMAFNGAPRYTGDIDFWINPTKENSDKVIVALKQIGFPVEDIDNLNFEEIDTVLMIGYPPNRIYILSSISGLDFDVCYKNKETIEYNGVILNFINLENLKINKRALGRKQDLADLDAIE